MDSITKYILEQNSPDTDVKEKIIKWFIDNPYPDDEKIHTLSDKLGIDPHKFEAIIYSILSSVLCEGRSKGKDVKGADSKQVEMGIKVEMEHTTSKTISRKIAMDHLVEIPDYYTRLAKMEKEAGVEH